MEKDSNRRAREESGEYALTFLAAISLLQETGE